MSTPTQTHRDHKGLTLRGCRYRARIGRPAKSTYGHRQARCGDHYDAGVNGAAKPNRRKRWRHLQWEDREAAADLSFVTRRRG